MYLERDNRLAFTTQEVVDLLMAAAREKFGDKIPHSARVRVSVVIDDKTGDEMFNLTWE